MPNTRWRIARNAPRPATSALKSAARWSQWPEQFPTFRLQPSTFNIHKESIVKFHLNKIKPSSVALAVLSVALLQPLAFGQMQMKPGSEAMPGGKTGTSSMPGGAMDMKGMDMKGMDMKGMMKDNNDKMSSMKMTGNTDVDFAMMMRIHHLGAIDMAQAELRDGKDPQMKKMAKAIIAAQKKEIAQFDKFLAKNGQTAAKINK
ncbi:DUF305 domain-containing protein [Polaromonas sp.]|uniref:DUF305 domain-containing protein n=1 Tax=Polaromonas sp. TaxID=1869339 RepID=UPI003753380F